MKKNPLRNPLLFLAFLLLACVPARAAQPGQEASRADDADAVRKKLIVAFYPVYKVVSFNRFIVDNPDIANQPFEAFRIVFSGSPLKQLLKDSKETAARNEFGDIIIVPVKSPFRLDKALALNKETVVRESPFFFSKFGFQWRSIRSDIKRYTLYIGKNDSFYFFGSSNLPFFFHLGYNFKLSGGFSPVDYLADALSVHDAGNITSESASVYLPKYGNAALPYLAKAIRSTLAMDEKPFAHFRVAARIGTPEAYDFMNSFVDPEKYPDQNILLPVFDAIVLFRLIDPRLAPCYKAMLREQAAVPFVLSAYYAMKKPNDIRADIVRIAETPKSYENYRFAKIAIANWNDPEKKTCHADAEAAIRALLARSGDTPDSMTYQNMEENSADREFRLGKEDQQRIKPYVDKLMQAPERDLTMIVALNLAMTSITSGKATKSYVKRVRATGIRLLKDMPDKQRDIAHAVRTLRTHIASESDRRILDDIAASLRLR